MGPPWWREAVIYQIYPRSFADSDGDGVGDLAGITRRLGYIAETGFDAIWLSPFYRSPMADFGYDISDHRDVDPTFGTLADFDELVAEAHRLGLRVIVDWVPNHTSIEHPWFVDSRSSRQSRHRDWYVWRDGRAAGRPPNNWQSQFPRVGSAWTFDEGTGQWYLHSYLPQQPDLDWGQPAVVEAMSDVLRFWLRRGVDGFRIDVPHRLGKDPLLRDNPALINEPERRFAGQRFDEDQASVLDHLRVVRRVVDEFADRLLVGEVYVLDQPRMVRYVNGLDGLHLAHNFTFLRAPWDARAVRETIAELDGALAPDAWPAWCLGNHDHARIASRFDGDGLGATRSRLANLLLLTLRGTPFIYQGDELGLPDSDVPPELRVDIHDRDRVRGPMPWEPPSSAGLGAGFSSVSPWLPVAAASETLNVRSQATDPRSSLSFVREALRLRRDSRALREGSMRLLDTPGGVLAYIRESDGQRLLVAIDFETSATDLPLGVFGVASATLLISSHPDRTRGPLDGQALRLDPLEGVVLELGTRP
jgi:alpha-glucosidase